MVAKDYSHPGNIGSMTLSYGGEAVTRLKPVMKRISLPWGYLDRHGARYTYIHDHQGNVRAVVDQNGVAVQTTDYYPYGLPMATSTNPDVNRRKHTGKEYESRGGLNSYDFTARQYNPVTLRMDRIDPFSGKYHGFSPYVFCAANPILFSDPSGKEIDFTSLIWADKSLKLNTSTRVIDDLIIQTGLSLSFDENNRLKYEKDENGMPKVNKYTDTKGNEVDAGSKTARNLLVKMIDHKETIKVSYSNASHTYDKEIGLNYDQISGMIGAAVGVDGNTLGFGMTFLHELLHTSTAGYGDDIKSDIGTGPVVDEMNKIRGELNQQGFNYGQRLNYRSIPSSQGNAVPFNRSALKSLTNERKLTKRDQYIIYTIK